MRPSGGHWCSISRRLRPPTDLGQERRSPELLWRQLLACGSRRSRPRADALYALGRQKPKQAERCMAKQRFRPIPAALAAAWEAPAPARTPLLEGSLSPGPLWGARWPEPAGKIGEACRLQAAKPQRHGLAASWPLEPWAETGPIGAEPCLPLGTSPAVTSPAGRHGVLALGPHLGSQGQEERKAKGAERLPALSRRPARSSAAHGSDPPAQSEAQRA